MIDGFAEAIPLPYESMDLITSNNGLNNVGDIQTAYAECSRILKFGGQFLQTMNTDKSMFEFYDILEDVLINMKLLDSVQNMKKHIYEKRKPIEEILSLLKQHSFNCKELVEDVFQYAFSNGTALLNHYFIRLAFMDSWVKLLPENKVEEVFSEVENQMNILAARNGNFKLSIPFVLINSFKN